jgi:peptidoglycan/xylan/chitin deacetylase (PgdA/CDA1 family)
MLVCAALVVLSMVFAAATSLGSSDIVRPAIEVSALPRTMALDVAGSDAVYISPAEQTAALRRLRKSKQPIFCGGTKNYAALTFDDGPSATSPQLLKLLRDEGIPATWFDLGRNAESFQKDLLAQAAHGPLANHTWDHKALTTLSPQDIEAELTNTQQLMKSQTGQNNMMMRPPYGARDDATQRFVRKLGYAEILWSADSQDALAKPWQTVAKNAVDGLGPGSILLFHDGPAATLTALKKKIIPAIHRSGLTMVTIPELLVLNPPTDQQLAAGPMGCTHAGRVNVSGTFLQNPETRY